MKRLVFYVRNPGLIGGRVVPLLPFVIGSGFEVTILHSNSIDHWVARGQLPVVPNCELIDVGRMSARRLSILLRALCPAAMVVYGFRSLFDLYISRVCKACSVPTIYLEHGFYHQGLSTKFVMAVKWSSVSRYIRYSLKYLGFLASRPKALFHEGQLVYRTMFRDDYRLTNYDHAIFYSRTGRLGLDGLFGYRDAEVGYSGYPVAMRKADLSSVARVCPIQKTALYLHQPFVLDRLSPITVDEDCEHITGVAAACRKVGYRLTLRLHPRIKESDYVSRLDGSRVAVDRQPALHQQVAGHEVVIGQYSTAIYSAILLDRPFIICPFPGLPREALELFSKIGVAAASVGDISNILIDKERLTHRLGCYSQFVESHIGTNNTFEHLAERICMVAQALNASGER